jgi:thioredoxin-like negative regulator of GroEL
MNKKLAIFLMLSVTVGTGIYYIQYKKSDSQEQTKIKMKLTKRKINALAGDAALENVVAQEPIVFTFFSKPGCPWCKKITPLMEQLAIQHSSIYLVRVEKEEVPKARKRHSITLFPSIVLFVDGKEERVLLGTQPIATYQQLLDKTLKYYHRLP